MKYNKVRMIAKAGNGLRIPKFQDSGSINLLDYNLYKGGLEGFMNSTPQEFFSLNPNPNNNGSTSPINISALQTDIIDNSNQMLNTLNKSGLRQRIKDFLSNNKQQFMNIGNVELDLLGSSFNNVENSSGIDTAFQVGDTATNILGTVNPVLGLAVKGVNTLLKGINSLGGKKSDAFSTDQNTIESVGGSYGGSVNAINSAAAKAGKKYGLFSSRKRRRANREIREARRQQNIMTNIADEAADQLGMINDINYLRYNSDINGGYDLANIRAAKSGMKILDKVNLIKKRNLHSSYINVDTKSIEEFKEGGSIQPEWMPVIEDIWEPIIEEFKEGDSLQSEQEPIIELQEGGKIKEGSSEIEETTQKNVIPEGALHKNKHHMEHTEGLTQKGIPVVDNEGNQQAEIELNEIIFNLEVTKFMEERYHKYFNSEITQKEKDQLAVEVGELLIDQILNNTDDRTNLIETVEV